MILFALFLTAGLDLFLPEFQPDDISGNYIVSQYDISENEYIAVDISSDDVSLNNVVLAFPAQGADASITEVYDDSLFLDKLDYVYSGIRTMYMIFFFDIILRLTYKVLDIFGGDKRA